MTVNRNEFLGLYFADVGDDSSVAASGSKVYSVVPPIGQCYQLVGMRINCPAPAGAGSGTHKITLNDQSSDVYWGTCTNVFGSAVQYVYGAWTGSSENPSGASEQMKLVDGHIWINNSQYLKSVYQNDTDAAAALARTVKFLFKVYKEVL